MSEENLQPFKAAAHLTKGDKMTYLPGTGLIGFIPRLSKLPPQLSRLSLPCLSRSEKCCKLRKEDETLSKGSNLMKGFSVKGFSYLVVSVPWQTTSVVSPVRKRNIDQYDIVAKSIDKYLDGWLLLDRSGITCPSSYHPDSGCDLCGQSLDSGLGVQNPTVHSDHPLSFSSSASHLFCIFEKEKKKKKWNTDILHPTI